jgi:hypothetical protein
MNVRSLLRRIPGIALILPVILSCSEDPNILNSLDTRFTDVDVEVIVDTLESTSGTSFRQSIPTNGEVNLVGLSGAHEARMTLQFTSGFVQRDTVEILSATLRLRGVTWFGDSSGMVSFNVHKILRPWSSLTLTWDSVASSGFYEEGVIRGSYTGTIMADTEYVSLNLDTAMVREWLRPSTFTQYGIALIPVTGSTVARGFVAFGTDSSQYVPNLTVIARNEAGTVTDTTVYTAGNDTFLGNIDNLVSDPGRIYVQAGVAYRSTLMFDASVIPPGAIVNKADLLLRLDQAASKVSRFTGDTLQAVHVRTSTTDSTMFESEGSIGRSGESGENLYELRHAVQLWVNGINNGLLVRASSLNEFSSLDQYVFYGPVATDPALRPKVRVTYTVERRR